MSEKYDNGNEEKRAVEKEEMKTAELTSKEFTVTYLGAFTAEQNWTNSKLNFVLNSIRKRGQNVAVRLEIKDSMLKGIDKETNNVLFAHQLQWMSRFAQLAQDRCLFTYLIQHFYHDQSSNSQTCYLFHAHNEAIVQDLFSAMRESTKEVQLLSSGGGNCNIFLRDGSNHNLSPSPSPSLVSHCSSQHFEVMYVGRIKVSHCKAPPTFIDEALDKFCQHELEKVRIRAAQNRKRHGSGAGMTTLPQNWEHPERSNSVRENDLKRQVNALLGNAESSDNITTDISRSGSTESLVPIGSTTSLSDPWSSNNNINENDTQLMVPRARANSGDAIRFHGLGGSSTDLSASGRRPRSETIGGGVSSDQNRTMLFQIGSGDVSLISLDKKLVILHKNFKDVSHCSQGIKHTDHFGFICRDYKGGDSCYIGYVFKCQSQIVADEIMGALKQAFTTAAQVHRRQPSPVRRGQFCETCPALIFFRLATQIDGASPNKGHSYICKYLEALPEAEQEEIKVKLEGAEVNSAENENEILVMLLRAHCETKQNKHIHTGELLYKADMSFLDKKQNTSVFDDLKRKAKRSLTSSFENILKGPRKPREDIRDVFRERSQTIDSDSGCNRFLSGDTHPSRLKPRKESLYDVPDGTELLPQIRPRSSTVGATSDINRENRNRLMMAPVPKSSPMMNIFMKVGNQAKTPPPETEKSSTNTPVRKLSWRQAIFHRVVAQPQKPIGDSPVSVIKASEDGGQVEKGIESRHRSAESLRALWKKAIMEQILLIRMEKENRKLKVSQDVTVSKRMKLAYEEITPCLKEVTKIWDDMLATAGKPGVNFERFKIIEAVKAGVPRQKRGDIWQFLAEQCQSVKEVSPVCCQVDLSFSYEDLLRQLTSHQHAILIDLGRTFPHHPYFARPLGPGQLSLFNLLKAYSLMDNEVGYCQGLSFIAGVLLLHMEEDVAFDMLKHLLFNQGIRLQYKPDMVALQIQMYQLSRLIHDTYPDLYQHFEMQEIAPTLYAAPWFLTMFASQFPLGFVSRVFDLLFLDGMEVVFKVALVLLGNHKELIMQCTTFESVMEFLKSTLPSLGIIQMERVFNQVFTTDISRKLQDYEIEYHVLQEEMFTGPIRSSSGSDIEAVQRLETTNWTLKRENNELQEQLQEAHATIHNLESLMATYQTNISHLETRIRELELDRLNLKKNVESLRHRLPEMDCYTSTDPEVLLCGGEANRSPLLHQRGLKTSLNCLDEAAADSEVARLTMPFSVNGSSKFYHGRHTSGDSSSSALSLTNSPILE